MSKGHTVGYVRVSTIDQNTARQLDGLQIDKVFTDKASGKDTNRPQLTAVLEYLREGDTLVVHEMSRLARSLPDLRRLVTELTGRGVAVRFVKEGLTFTGDDAPMSTLLLNMLGAVAEFERALLLERQREGIAIAKTKGVYKGRKPALTEDQTDAVAARLDDGESAAALAREYGVSRATVYNARTRAWTEAEVFAVDDFYREHGTAGAGDAGLVALADRLGRTPSAVAARLRGLHGAHTEQGYPGKAWHFTKLDRKAADRTAAELRADGAQVSA